MDVLARYSMKQMALQVLVARGGGGCEFISAPLAVTNKSGGDFSPLHVWQRRKRWMHTVNISHS